MYKLNSEVRNLILIFELLNVNCFHIKNDRPYSVLWQTNQFEEEVAVHNHLRSVKGSTIWNQIPTVAGLWLFILACSLLQCRANASYVYVYGLRVHTFNVHIICYYQRYQKAYIHTPGGNLRVINEDVQTEMGTNHNKNILSNHTSCGDSACT